MAGDLTHGQRVAYQPLHGRFGAVAWHDRGTVSADDEGRMAVVWDTGEVDDITPRGFVPQHGFLVRALPKGWPDVRGPLPGEPGEDSYVRGIGADDNEIAERIMEAHDGR